MTGRFHLPENPSGTSQSLSTSKSPKIHDTSNCSPFSNPFNLREGRALDAKGRSTQASLFARYFEESWVGELLAWILAALCLAIILIVLILFRDKSLQSWNSRFTINTLVNFGSQAAQTCLLVTVGSSISQLKWIWYRHNRPLRGIDDFDRASRQPLDSILLVWKHPKWFDSTWYALLMCLSTTGY